MKIKRVWTCEHCGKKSLWGKTWRWFYGVFSSRYRNENGEFLPMAGCTPEHADKALDAKVREVEP